MIEINTWFFENDNRDFTQTHERLKSIHYTIRTIDKSETQLKKNTFNKIQYVIPYSKYSSRLRGSVFSETPLVLFTFKQMTIWWPYNS